MMVPDGASSSNANQVEAQQAEVVGQPSTMVKVAVPTGATPGQQINFTLPNGQRVTTSVQESRGTGVFPTEGVQPGTVLTVAVPSMPERVAAAPAAFSTDDHLAQAREALLPRPTVVNAVEADQRCATFGWIVYGLSFLVCCLCSFPVALCIWGIVALDYFCKPYEDTDWTKIHAKMLKHATQQFENEPYRPYIDQMPGTGDAVGLCLALLAMMGMAFVAMFCATDTNKTEMCTDLQKILNHTDAESEASSLWGNDEQSGSEASDEAKDSSSAEPDEAKDEPEGSSEGSSEEGPPSSVDLREEEFTTPVPSLHSLLTEDRGVGAPAPNHAGIFAPRAKKHAGGWRDPKSRSAPGSRLDEL
eukprot:g22294.t1